MKITMLSFLQTRHSVLITMVNHELINVLQLILLTSEYIIVVQWCNHTSFNRRSPINLRKWNLHWEIHQVSNQLQLEHVMCKIHTCKKQSKCMNKVWNRSPSVEHTIRKKCKEESRESMPKYEQTTVSLTRCQSLKKKKFRWWKYQATETTHKERLACIQWNTIIPDHTQIETTWCHMITHKLSSVQQKGIFFILYVSIMRWIKTKEKGALYYTVNHLQHF
jgi:hypothetical protein